MEYLMTYGWAILIIAVVLGALFSLGVFSTGSFLSNACIPSSGYLCTIGSYPHGGTTFTVTLGQSTTSSWTANVFVAFVPQGTTLATGGVPDVAAANVVTLSTSAFPAGASQSVTLYTGGAAGNVGSTATGSIWVCYGSTSAAPAAVTFNALAGCSYVQLATLTVKAT